MLNKKVPLRMCVACKSSKPKNELLRIVKTDTEFVLDKKGKMNGRGAYICNDNECLEKLCKQKILNKVYKQNISLDVYNKIKEQFFGIGEN